MSSVESRMPFSRMYLGVHTPADVLVGSGMAMLLVVFLKPVSVKDDLRVMKILIAGMLAMAVGLLLYVEYWKFPADMDAHNLESGIKNAYTMIGCITGTAIVYLAERKYVNFDPKACWWAQILKIVLGLALVFSCGWCFSGRGWLILTVRHSESPSLGA